VIIASGFVLDQILDEMKAAGLCGVIKKPYLTADLSKIVSRAI